MRRKRPSRLTFIDLDERADLCKYPTRSQIFTSLHPPGTLSLLPPTAYLGPVDPTTIKQSGPAELDEDEIRVKKAREEMPPIDSILLLQDMEDLAEKVMSKTGWGYYRSASDTEDCKSRAKVLASGVLEVIKADPVRIA